MVIAAPLLGWLVEPFRRPARAGKPSILFAVGRGKLQTGRVAVLIDARVPLRSPLELAGLVSAIVAASPNDETDWLEWKSGLDLARKDSHVTIARHILGLSNRRVADAIRQAGGCGYIVIGAEPGSVTGVTEVDPADLSQAIQVYLGSAGPSWSPSYISAAGASVLVITVEPPAAGDRVRTLQREFQSYLAGAIFVRRQGRTVPALPGDVMALEDRFAEPLLAAGLDRERQRLEKISQTVEDLFGQVIDADPSDRSPSRWYTPRNQLRTLLVGLEDQLPICAQIVNAGTAYQARNLIPGARNEIEAVLRQLAQQRRPPLRG